MKGKKNDRIYIGCTHETHRATLQGRCSLSWHFHCRPSQFLAREQATRLYIALIQFSLTRESVYSRTLFTVVYVFFYFDASAFFYREREREREKALNFGRMCACCAFERERFASGFRLHCTTNGG